MKRQANVASLVAVDPDRQDQPSPIIERDASASPFLALYPWNLALDSSLRQRHVVDPGELYPLAGANRRDLIELGTVFGQEGYDFQNPYAWASRGVLVEPTPQHPGLFPDYGVNAGETTADVALNVQAGAGVLDLGPIG